MKYVKIYNEDMRHSGVMDISAALDKKADIEYVNELIQAATATFRGTYNVVTDLSLAHNATHSQIEDALETKMAALSIVPDNNDYSFVQIPTSDETQTKIAKVEKYTYNGSEWAYEYELNNSGFTDAQWSAINSGATLELIGKLSALPTNAELTTLLNAKVSYDDNGAYDVSAHNSGATFASLSALLSNENIDTLIPAAVRKGGMSIRFVQTYDNKYVQYMYVGTSTVVADFTNTNNWEKLNLEEEVISINGEITDFSQTILETKKLIDNVIVGATLYYDFSNTEYTVGCIGFFDSSDNIIGTYIGNESSAAIGGTYKGTIEVPIGAKYLKAVVGASMNITLYYKSSVIDKLKKLENEIEVVNDKFNEIYDINDSYFDIQNPPESGLYVPSNNLCFTYSDYLIDDSLPVVLLYAPNVANTIITGSINLVKIIGAVGQLLLSEDFSITIDSNGYGKVYLTSPWDNSYSGANVCLQLNNANAVSMKAVAQASEFKYYNPSDNSITNYSSYIGLFTIAKENPFATKEFVKQYVDESVSPISICTPADDLQDFITNHRIVNLISGTYNVSTTLTIPSNTRITGVRGGTILKLSGSNTNIITFESGEENVQIENVTFEGNTQISRIAKTVSQLRSRDGIGTDAGIYFYRHTSTISIENCNFKNFNNAGISIYQTEQSPGQQALNVKVSNCSFYNCWAGVLLGQRAEFHTFVNCSFNQCIIGAYVCGGNNAFDSCRFDLNGTGMVVYGQSEWNDSHGLVTNSSFNHSSGFGIVATGANNGFTFTNCHIFDGTGIVISDSIGIAFVGGMIACKIVMESVRNAGFNLIHDVMFGSTATYNTGTIEGDTTRLSMKNNRFLAQDDYTSINNNN